MEDDIVVAQESYTERALPRQSTLKETTSSYDYASTPTSSFRYARDSYPSAADLRRRPLNTPVMDRTRSNIETTRSTTTTTTSTTSTTAPNAKGKSWLCSRLFLIVLALVVCFVFVVYYHMEHNDLELLTPAPPVAVPPATPAPPAADSQKPPTTTWVWKMLRFGSLDYFFVYGAVCFDGGDSFDDEKNRI